MALYKLHLRYGSTTEPDDDGIEVRDLHHAYLEACKAIPDVAREMLVEGRDPLACAFLICDAAGCQLMEVLFSEVLSPSEWRMRRVRRGPHGFGSSVNVRDGAALSGFRRMFSDVNVGCVLLTPELSIVEMNSFGAKHGHVDAEAIRGASILDIFAFSQEAGEYYAAFMRLGQVGMLSEIVDLPYLALNEAGETIAGWWSACTWPIFDDDNRLAGIAEWATPSPLPLNAGQTKVSLSRNSLF